MKYFKSLFVQVIIAILIGILLGTFYPAFAIQLKPLGDGFKIQFLAGLTGRSIKSNQFV